MTHTLYSQFERCSYCQGSGTVVQPGSIAPSHQQRLSGGIATCPRCYGSGEDRSRPRTNASHGSGKSPEYIQGEKLGEGCATVIFAITPYLIVCYVLFNVIINATNMLSSTFSLNFPEWLPGLIILIAYSIVLLYKRHIGLMAIFGIAIIVVSMVLSEYGDDLKFEFGQTETKQIPKGCSICQDVIKNGVKITPEYKAFFELTHEMNKDQFILRCSGIKDYCKNSHSIQWQ